MFSGVTGVTQESVYWTFDCIVHELTCSFVYMHCNEDWARSQESSDVWWRTPPASAEGPQANIGPMADAVETEEWQCGNVCEKDLFICSHNQRTHVEHADAGLQKVGL